MSIEKIVISAYRNKALKKNLNAKIPFLSAMLHPNDDFKIICSFEGSDGSIWIDKGMC